MLTWAKPSFSPQPVRMIGFVSGAITPFAEERLFKGVKFDGGHKDEVFALHPRTVGTANEPYC